MLNSVFKKVSHIPSKLKRECLKIPVLQSLSKHSYHAAIQKYATSLPIIPPQDSAIVDSIKEKGVFVTSLEYLGIDSTHLMIDTAKKLLPQLKAIPSNRKSSIGWVMSKDMMQDRAIFLWGLEKKLLDIVENYIGLPAQYVGMHVRRQVANGRIEGVRQWHIDVEDYRRIKIIIYLNSVNEEEGPFEYLTKDLTSIASKKLKYSDGFVSDKLMEAVVPKSNWTSCTGSAGTVIFADTCSIFHRAKPPTKSDRFSVTFGYTSRNPIALYYPLKLSQAQWLAISDNLTERQKNCLFNKQGFF